MTCRSWGSRRRRSEPGDGCIIVSLNTPLAIPPPCGEGRKRSERGGVFTSSRKNPTRLRSAIASARPPSPQGGGTSAYASRAKRITSIQNFKQRSLLRTSVIAPGLFAAPGRRILPRLRGAIPVPSGQRPRVGAPDGAGHLTPCGVARLGESARALRRSVAALFRSRAALSRAVARPDQPAPGGRTVVSARRCPGPPQSEVTSLARRSRIPSR
jgi:hypothetical protein